MSENEKMLAGLQPHKGEEFLQMFYKGVEFTKDLMKENEKLRYKILELEEKTIDARTNPNEKDYLGRLEKEIEQLKADKSRLLKKHEEIERENQDFAGRYLDIQEEHNNLANLYIVSHQLHSTLDYKEVLRTILEIVINLVGAETFCIMLLDEKHDEMATVAAEGIDPRQIGKIKIGQGTIGRVAKEGESYFTEDGLCQDDIDLENPIACVPLKINDNVIGLLVVYKLLIQKETFKNIDFELFSLLASQAATAIYSSKLYSKSERKLSTIQGFLDLLSETPSQLAQ